MVRGGSIGLAAALLLSAGPAAAGAWTQEAGRGLAILTIERTTADRRFERDGPLAPADRFEKREARLLLEYGLTDRVTVRGQGAVEDGRRDGDFPESWRGAGVQEIGGRVRLIRRGGLVGSAEASLRVADALGAVEAEGRLLAGYGRDVLGLPAFLDVQLGYRHRPDGSSDEMLLDLTAGLRATRRTLLLLQTFSTLAASAAADGSLLYDRHRVQGSLVFDLSERWSVQLGAGRTAFGTDALEERSLLAAAWLRF